ncbi:MULTISPECIES: hypothetical protein [unclassified Ensifer]|uniref:hypothetical protein n=1 Tax=unclassified Ensifer TaxID=2633371 RepID=UPI000812FCA1|nr:MULTISPECIES: hypothetical protein [unclassified Ensifer]OCP00502.1 hypothetical protein BC362_24225 [Ensifer sp. LC14]OCP05872.1 hypothetical protein BBX50_05190 [Ensifer sp. LC11]OCP06621.1 hypothetical protein BC374_05250 [Ensifer sp. LC13]OCP31139.1 hypothetical protein BC364_04845 [Ensifer sp. LC499]
MAIKKIVARSMMALTLAVAPLAGGTLWPIDAAYAKDGNGGGGGGGGGGNGGGNGGGHGSNRDGGSAHGKSDNTRASKGTKSDKSGGKSLHRSQKSSSKAKTSKPAKTEKVAKSAPVVSDPLLDPVVTPGPTPGFRSLNRNYHAYLNSNDPKMAAVSAYAIAYAEFEAENGVDAIPTDPALSDEALREALASFTKDGVVTDDMVDEAKGILGVGPAIGKIDDIRNTLPPPALDVDVDDPEAVDPEAEPAQ